MGALTDMSMKVNTRNECAPSQLHAYDTKYIHGSKMNPCTNIKKANISVGEKACNKIPMWGGYCRNTHADSNDEAMDIRVDG